MNSYPDAAASRCEPPLIPTSTLTSGTYVGIPLEHVLEAHGAQSRRRLRWRYLRIGETCLPVVFCTHLQLERCDGSSSYTEQAPRIPLLGESPSSSPWTRACCGSGPSARTAWRWANQVKPSGRKYTFKKQPSPHPPSRTTQDEGMFFVRVKLNGCWSPSSSSSSCKCIPPSVARDGPPPKQCTHTRLHMGHAVGVGN